MTRCPWGVVPAPALLVCLVGGAVGAQVRVTVTVRQLFDQGHRLEDCNVYKVDPNQVSWKWTT